MQLIYVLLLTFLSCKHSPDQPINDSKQEAEKRESRKIFSIAVKSDLPDCTEENRTQLAYVINSKKFFVCEDEWSEIDISDDDKNVILSDKQWKDTSTGIIWTVMGTFKRPEVPNCILPSKEEIITARNNGLSAAFDIKNDSSAISSTRGNYIWTSKSTYIVNTSPKRVTDGVVEEWYTEPRNEAIDFVTGEAYDVKESIVGTVICIQK